jgi:hypothetical protein
MPISARLSRDRDRHGVSGLMPVVQKIPGRRGGIWGWESGRGQGDVYVVDDSPRRLVRRSGAVEFAR